MKYWIRLLIKTGLSEYVNLKVKDSRNFTIPLVGGIGTSLLVDQERWMDSILGRLSPSIATKTFVDIGANVGQTLLKVKFVNKNAAYIGFEPNPTCLFYLQKLISANRLSNTTIFPVAVSDHSGIGDIQFYSQDTVDPTASIVPNFRGRAFSTSKIPVINGSEFEFINCVGVIKIDVEGGELEVLRSFSTIIDRDRPFILCEVLPVYKEENVLRLERQTQLEALVVEKEYKIMRIGSEGNIYSVTKIGIHDELLDSNYLFYPAERESEISANAN